MPRRYNFFNRLLGRSLLGFGALRISGESTHRVCRSFSLGHGVRGKDGQNNAALRELLFCLAPLFFFSILPHFSPPARVGKNTRRELGSFCRAAQQQGGLYCLAGWRLTAPLSDLSCSLRLTLASTLLSLLQRIPPIIRPNQLNHLPQPLKATLTHNSVYPRPKAGSDET
jgi:hypothetical protein